ncbi:hypothetical protein DFH06DRAFT_1350385 [Mycena polygramma]|nr:hypothetical protein DFH06DRAFT_1350385 [Mycena polygramma]
MSVAPYYRALDAILQQSPCGGTVAGCLAGARAADAPSSVSQTECSVSLSTSSSRSKSTPQAAPMSASAPCSFLAAAARPLRMDAEGLPKSDAPPRPVLPALRYTSKKRLVVVPPTRILSGWSWTATNWCTPTIIVDYGSCMCDIPTAQAAIAWACVASRRCTAFPFGSLGIFVETSVEDGTTLLQYNPGPRARATGEQGNPAFSLRLASYTYASVLHSPPLSSSASFSTPGGDNGLFERSRIDYDLPSDATSRSCEL